MLRDADTFCSTDTTVDAASTMPATQRWRTHERPRPTRRESTAREAYLKAWHARMGHAVTHSPAEVTRRKWFAREVTG